MEETRQHGDLGSSPSVPSDLSDQEQSRLYLENFWVLKLGSSVKDQSGEVKKVTWVEPEFPAQIQLEGDTHITFSQDISWNPGPAELDELLLKMGIMINDADVRVGDSAFLLRPRTWEEYAQTIRTHRHLNLARGVDILAAMQYAEPGVPLQFETEPPEH